MEAEKNSNQTVRKFGKKLRDAFYCHDCVPDCGKCSNELQSTGGLVKTFKIFELSIAVKLAINTHIKVKIR